MTKSAGMKNEKTPVSAPFDIRAFVQSNDLILEWKRSSGIVSGFIVYLGPSVYQLKEWKKIPCGFKKTYVEKITGLDDQVYFVTVAAYQGAEKSRIPDPIKIELGNRKTKPIASSEKKVKADEAHESSAAENKNVCGRCQGEIFLNGQEHVFECRGCGTRYVQRAVSNQFIPLDQLIRGICSCCNPKRALVAGDSEQSLVCSNSGEKYAKLKNRTVRSSELDYGLCTCCNPPAELVLNHHGQVVCSEAKDHLYIKKSGRYIYEPATAPPGSFDEINDALSGRSAVMLPNGVLVSGDERKNR